MSSAIKATLCLTVAVAAAVGSVTVAAPSALAGPALGAGSGTTVLSHDVLPGIATMTPTGAPAATSTMTAGVTIAGRNQAGLAALISSQYDPASPNFHRYLTPSLYTALFGADQADTDAVARWLTAGGLKITFRADAGTMIEVEGTVAAVEKRFGVSERTFRAADGSAFFAATSAPSVPAGVGITSVEGLQNLSRAHTDAELSRAAGLAPRVAPAVAPADFPLASVTHASDLWSVYSQPSNNRGSGQAMAAFGFGGPGAVESDLRVAETNNKLPQVPFTIVTVGTPSTDTSGQDEWDLDSQSGTGMAPDVKGFTFYFANSGTGDNIGAAIQTWAQDPNAAKQASGSFGACEAFASLGEFTAEETGIQQGAAEGRSFFASSGDQAAGCAVGANAGQPGPIPSQEYPATSAYAVAVGGTVLYATGTDTLTGPSDGSAVTRQSEYAWSNSGGGPAHFEPRPSWQGVLSSVTRNPTSAAVVAGQECIPGTDESGNVTAYAGDCRVEADVSAQGGDLTGGYDTVVSGQTEAVLGTSLSAPLWQGMWARVNAAAPKGADGSYDLGFADPLLYQQIYTDPTTYARDFYDVTMGANGYPAAANWDYPTGMGTPNVTNLMKDLDNGNTNPTNPSAANPVLGGTGGGGITPVANQCGGYPQVTDPTGDATQAGVEDTGQGTADDPQVDVTSAGLFTDAKGLHAAITVANLNQTPEQGSGENYRFVFSVGTTQYQLQAAHTAVSATSPTAGATTYTFGTYGVNATSVSTTGSRGVLSGNTLVMDLPQATYASIAGAGATLVGTTLSGLDVLAQRTEGAATLTADEATAGCSYVVGAATPAAALPEAPYVPLLLLVGGAPVATVLLRRRRRAPGARLDPIVA